MAAWIPTRRRTTDFSRGRARTGTRRHEIKNPRRAAQGGREDTRMHLMTSTTSSANVPGAGKGSTAKAPINKKQILMLCWAAGLIAAAVAGYFVWQKLRPQEPRLNDPITKIAAFVTSPRFDQMDFLK